MGNITETCKNCEQEFNKDYKFCPHCGQQAKDNLTVGLLFYNTISNYFSFDARFFKSFFPLLFRPGYLAKKFIGGKRLIYLHPAQLYLFISVVFFFLMSTLVVSENVQNIDKALKKATIKPFVTDSLKLEAEKVLDSIKLDSVIKPLKENAIKGLDMEQVRVVDSIIKSTSAKDLNNGISFDYNTKKVDSLIALNATESEVYRAMGMEDDAGYLTRKFYKQTLKFQKQRNGGQILQAVFETIPIALFVLLPIFALLLKLFFYKRGSYAHHLVFSFYYFAFLFTAFSLILIANYFFEVPNWIDFIIVLLIFLYLLIAVKKFYEIKWFLCFIKTGVISFLYLSFVIPIAFVILMIVGFLFY